MLQGSLDNFTLDEVLNLLAGTQKTGHLRISGDRGTGSLWVDEGELVQAEASNVADDGDWDDVMFELLRFESGNFSFVPDETAPSPSASKEIEPLVERGRELLLEWRSIESVVKSPDHFLTTVAALPSEQVMLTSGEWETVVAIGEGHSVAQTCSRLGVGELKGCRRIKSVVERGLVAVGDPAMARHRTTEATTLAEAAVDSPPTPQIPLPRHTAEPIDEPIAGLPPMPQRSLPPTPPPAPPSPEEIRRFSESVADPAPLDTAIPPPPPPPPPGSDDPAVNEDGSAAADDEASLLMKYLQSES